MRAFLSRLVRRSRLESEMDEELTFHLESRAGDLMRKGIPEEEARRRARLEFGGIEGYKERCREAWGLRLADELRSDLRYSARSLGKAPAFSAAALLSLTLGIGANTLIFSVVHGALFRPLPYRGPDRLVAVYENHFSRGVGREAFAAANFFDLRASSGAFEDLAAHMPTGVTLAGAEQAEQLAGRLVTGNAFALLGVPAAIGRTLLPDDDRPGSPRVVLLSHRLWMRRFAGDPNVLGRTVTLDGGSYAVAGVMPASFRFPGALGDEFWMPLRYTARAWQERTNHNFWCLGRLKRGSTLRQAQTEAASIARRLRSDYPATNAGIDFRLLPLREALSGSVRRPLLLLFAAVGLVLLIACANVTNLALTRCTVRRREFAVRAAIGASRLRLIRQVTAENLLLAAGGGALAIGACLAAARPLALVLPVGLLPAGGISIDWVVLAFALGTSLLAAVACGFAPAALLSGADLQKSLGASSRSATGTAGERRTRGALVIFEVALALVLMIGAGLLLKSFARLLEVDPGVRTDGVLAVEFVLPNFRYPEHAQRVSFYEQLLERVQALPGVESAALITSLPFTGEGGSSWFTVEGRVPARPEELIANNRLVSDGYFSTMGIPLRQGRAFDRADGLNALPIAVINETMARRFWPGENPIGKRFKFGFVDSAKPWIQVIGIVRDVRQNGLASDPKPEIYRPFRHDSQFWLTPQALVIRSRTDPAALAASVRREIRAADKNVPIHAVHRLSELVSASVAARRLGSFLLGLFALVALVLAAIGISGVVAYSAARSAREMAIRIALGATRADVLGLMLRKGLLPVVIGVAAGLVLAAVFTRSLAALLFNVGAADVLTFMLAPALMLAAALVACYLPARRAAGLNPETVLRSE